MLSINMLSSAQKVKGHGVSSAYIEQVSLVKKGLKNCKIWDNKFVLADIMHYHTIDLKHYFLALISHYNSVNVGYVHFLPETLKGSLQLPKWIQLGLNKYIISFYKQMDYLVTVNPCFISKLVKYGINKNKIVYIPNFVSDEHFFPLKHDERMAIRGKYDIGKDRFVVLGVGQVQTRKGIMDFINTAEKLKDITFIWAGGFSFGRITSGYNELKQIVENPPENVKFLGILEREQMNDIYNLSDLLFLPSYNELFPMTILEAFNCGLPVLLRDLDNYPDILFDYYLKGKNVDEFVTKINELEQDKEYLNFWKDQALKGHEFYSEQSVFKMWQEFYNKIIHSKSLKQKLGLANIIEQGDLK